MADAPNNNGEPANLRILRYSVLAMTIVFIVGFAIIVAIVYLQYAKSRNSFESIIPDSVALPEGSEARAFTRGDGWFAVVTQRNEILIFDSGTGRLTQTVEIQ